MLEQQHSQGASMQQHLSRAGLCRACLGCWKWILAFPLSVWLSSSCLSAGNCLCLQCVAAPGKWGKALMNKLIKFFLQYPPTCPCHSPELQKALNLLSEKWFPEKLSGQENCSLSPSPWAETAHCSTARVPELFLRLRLKPCCWKGTRGVTEEGFLLFIFLVSHWSSPSLWRPRGAAMLLCGLFQTNNHQAYSLIANQAEKKKGSHSVVLSRQDSWYSTACLELHPLDQQLLCCD